jgi:CobQ/CobB/MinD/ParA family nucleotide binding protein
MSANLALPFVQSALDMTHELTEGRRMSIVHLVGGEKGGVGKSVVARLLAQLFIDRGVRFVALDADGSHGALLRYYAEFSEPVDLSKLDGADQIFVRAEEESNRAVLVDLPAQSHRALKHWIEENNLLDYARETGVELVYWHVTDGGYDSVAHLEKLTEELGESVRFVVVKNQGRSKDFSQLEASPAFARVKALGGQVVTLPELDSAVIYKIDRFGSSFWAAVNAGQGERTLSPLERRRAKSWLERAHKALTEAAQLRTFPVTSPTSERSVSSSEWSAPSEQSSPNGFGAN